MSTKKTAKKTPKKVATKKPKAKVTKATTKAGQKSVTQKRASNGAGKRTPEELVKLKATIVERVEIVGGGVTGEQLAKEIGVASKELSMPLRQLRAAGTLTTTGQRRFLRYFPKGKAPKATASATAKKAPAKGKAKK